MIWKGLVRSPSIRIGLLEPYHAPTLAEIHAGAFAQGWSVEEFQRLQADRTVISQGAFLQRTEKPSGFILSRDMKGEAEVLTLAVARRSRGCGIGTALLKAHLASLMALGAEKLFLDVGDGNAPALALYRRFGFVEIGRRSAYYAKPGGARADALTMRKDLA